MGGGGAAERGRRCSRLEEAMQGTGCGLGVGDTVTGKDRGERWRIVVPKRPGIKGHQRKGG